METKWLTAVDSLCLHQEKNLIIIIVVVSLWKVWDMTGTKIAKNPELVLVG